MDSLTHIVSGACIGEALLGRKIGRKAMLLGGIAQSLPDIDFIVAFWMDPTSNLLSHRGFTHSLLFALLATIGLGYLCYRRWKQVELWRWFLLFGIELSLHLFFDLFNTYGMGLLEPFSHARLSFNAVFVADPFFTLPYLAGAIALLVVPLASARRRFWWLMGVGLSTAYLGFALHNKWHVHQEAASVLSRQQVSWQRIFTTPTPLNNLLWYIAAEDSGGYHIGYCSAVDGREQARFRYFPKNRQLLKEVRDAEELSELLRFSQGFYTLEKWHDTLVFNDLRFGQIVGWHDPAEKFVFHYYLDQPPPANHLVVQRGRFARWDGESMKSMIRAIRGD